MVEGVTINVEKRVSDEERMRVIGSAIRSKRQELGLSLRELSRLSGLSIGFLSLVERGRSSLALTSLSNIAKALGIELSSFFPPVGVGLVPSKEEPLEIGLAPTPSKEGLSPYVHRANDRSQLALISSQRTYTMLSPRGPGLILEPIFVTIQPGDLLEEPYGHEGEEFAYVLSGELVFIVENVEYRLGPGDSIHLRSHLSHAMRNDTDRPVEAIWVLTPRLM